MLVPLIQLISSVIHLYIFCVIAWAVIGTLIYFKIINPWQPLVKKVMYALGRLVEPALLRIRKYLPDLGGVDISPVILILLLNFADGMVKYVLYSV